MSPDVLRRKLQKKKKHKPYRKCPRCGSRMECRISTGDGPRLFKECPDHGGCGYKEELFWSGGMI